VRDVKFRPRSLALALVLLAALTACSGAAGSTASSGSGGTKQIRVAFFSAVQANTFIAAMYKGMQSAAAKQGNVSITVFDANFDATKQLNQVEDALTTKRFDAFVIVPLNYAAMVAPTKTAIAQKIQVVTWNWPIGNKLDTVEPQVPGMAGSVLTPATVDGAHHVEMINAACQGLTTCNVAYVAGAISGAFDVATMNLIKENAKTHPFIHVVQEVEGGYARNPSLKVVQNVLQAHPNVNVIDAHGDQMALGAEDAVKSANLVGKVKILGGGASVIGVTAVRAGRWFGTTLTLPETDGTTSMDLAIKGVLGQSVADKGVDNASNGQLPAILTQANTASWKAFQAQWAG
jgi:ribose transport system substrate-binding protein